MQCPYCQTENREDRESCYVCGKDISTVRLVVNKARQNYNDALEHVERGRTIEAIDELKNAIDLDASLVNAHVVLGTLHARQGNFDEARESWQNALALQPELARAHEYLDRVDIVQTALPTLKIYRWIAVILLLTAMSLAALLIYALRPDQGLARLQHANALIEARQYGEAMEELEQAQILAEPDGPVATAAAALDHTMNLDMRQQVHSIQDLKYRQMYPEALSAIAELESARPDVETSAALATIREDINYYYRSLISQLYSAYEQGDVDFATLRDEIRRFTNVYPNSPERDNIMGYLEQAESIEVRAVMDELRRRFAQDNNVETAVEGLRDLDPQFGDIPSFKSERSAFIEEILSYLFNLFTGYLEQEDFSRASALLTEIDRVTTEFRDVVEVDISGAVDLAWSVLHDARRQYQLGEIGQLISRGDLDAAQEAVWEILREPDLSPVEMNVIRSYWRKINRRDLLAEFYEQRGDDSEYFELEISNAQASETLQLYEDLDGMRLPRRQRVHLLGLAAVSAMRLGQDDKASSMALTLRDLDEDSTVTETVRELIRERVDDKTETTSMPNEEEIRIEPADEDDTSNE